jgi:transposase
MIPLLYIPSLRTIGQLEGSEVEIYFLVYFSSKNSCVKRYFSFACSSDRTLLFAIVQGKLEDEHARVSELSAIETDRIEQRANVILSLCSAAFSVIFRSCPLQRWSALRSISETDDQTAHQPSLLDILLTVCVDAAGCGRVMCLYCRQRACANCGVLKSKEKLDGHLVCWECRSSTSSSLATTPVRFNPSAFVAFFNHEHAQGAHLSLVQRTSIVALSKLGLGAAKIADLTSCDPRTTQRWIDHFDEVGNLQDEPRSGRPPLTSTDTNELIVSLAQEVCFITPKEIRTDVHLDVSARTVRRRLDDAGLFGRVARISFPFTQEHINKRLAFAHKYGDWDKPQWEKVLFTDETYIILGGNGQVWVQRPEDSALLSQYMIERSTHADQIGFWGCFSAQGIGTSRLYDHTMDSRFLTDTYNQYMRTHARRTWPSGPWYLLQDNAPSHTSVETKAWLHNNGITCIEFPPHSPDLNPIENLWAQLKRRIDNRCPSSKAELMEILNQEWAAIDPEFLTRLAHSMIDRCKSVVACRGFKTKY